LELSVLEILIVVHLFWNFDVLLTVHLSIFILVINQLDAQNLFYNKFISRLYMFRAPCAHRKEVKIVLHSLWYHHTYNWLITKIKNLFWNLPSFFLGPNFYKSVPLHLTLS